MNTRLLVAEGESSDPETTPATTATGENSDAVAADATDSDAAVT